MKKKKMNKIKQKALTEALSEISDCFEADFWGTFTHRGREYDFHYLDDEDVNLYVYKVLGDTRAEHELFVIKIKERQTGVTREMLEDFERRSEYIVSDNGSVHKLFKNQIKIDKSLIVHSQSIEIYSEDLKYLEYEDGLFTNIKDDYSFQFAKFENISQS